MKTEHGWLLIYHGVKETVTGGMYRVGLALLDLERADARAAALPGLGASGRCADYERQGDVPNALFPCGLVHDEPAGEVRLYYGAADTSIASRRRSSTTCSTRCWRIRPDPLGGAAAARAATSRGSRRPC